MNNRDVFIDAMGDIDSAFLSEHIEKNGYPRTRRGFAKYAAVAACAVLVIAVLASPLVARLGGNPGGDLPGDDAVVVGEASGSETDTVSESVKMTDEVTQPHETDTGNDTETDTPPIGGSICQYHYVGYHASIDWMEDYIEGGKKKIREHETQVLSENPRVITDEENPCPYPFSNILESIEYFNISRETFEKAYNVEIPDIYYDIDAIFGDDPERFEEWAALSWDEGDRLCQRDKNFNEFCYKQRIIEFCSLDEDMSEKFGDFLVDEDNLLLASYAEDFVSAEVSVTAENREDLKYELLALSVDSPRKFTFAQIVKESGIAKEDVIRIYDENIANENDEHWQYDIDKLYENLDCYATLLGTEGYDYPWQVDALIRK